MSHSPLTLASKKPHLCPECHKSFSSVHQLAQHNRVHSGEKPYACAYCERKFKQLSHLQQHTRLHTGERPYKCDCGRSFIQLSNLQQHMKTHDLTDSSSSSSKDAEKNFFCNHCGKGFKGQSSLYIHQTKKHSDLINSAAATQNVMTYSCHVCNKIYLDEMSYKKHLESHYQESNNLSTSSSTGAVTLWPCSTCAVVYANEIGLLSHLEQMKFDPKHQRNAQQLLLQSIKTKKMKEEESDIPNFMNDILVNTLISSNGAEVNLIENSGQQQQQQQQQQQHQHQQQQIISANMIAQNLLNNLNQSDFIIEYQQTNHQTSNNNLNTNIKDHSSSKSTNVNNFRETNNDNNSYWQ